MKYSINLFPTKESQLPKQIFEFVAYYLRYALVITLFIVIVVFFLRMQVDRALVEEKEKLGLKKSIVTVTKDLREELEHTQKRITLVKDIFVKQDTFRKRLDYFLSSTPRDATISVVSFAEREMQIEGSTKDYRIVQLYANKLRKEKMFESVTIDSISRNKERRYLFSLTLVFRSEGKSVAGQKGS